MVTETQKPTFEFSFRNFILLLTGMLSLACIFSLQKMINLSSSDTLFENALEVLLTFFTPIGVIFLINYCIVYYKNRSEFE